MILLHIPTMRYGTKIDYLLNWLLFCYQNDVHCKMLVSKSRFTLKFYTTVDLLLPLLNEFTNAKKF